MFTRAIAQVPLTVPSHTGQPPLTCVAWRGDWTGGAAHKAITAGYPAALARERPAVAPSP